MGDPAVIGVPVPADAVSVLALHQAVIREGRWFLSEPGEGASTPEVWRGRILDRAGVCRVARLGPRLVGWAHVLPGPYRRVAHVGHLEIFVGEASRGHGVGARLLAAVLDGVREHPVLEKVGLSVRADNGRAIHLYEEAGFVIEGRRKGEIREPEGDVDDLLMAWWARR